ncbi:hypothetical protein V6N13_099525 [Hibiscus sabdariffa]
MWESQQVFGLDYKPLVPDEAIGECLKLVLFKETLRRTNLAKQYGTWTRLIPRSIDSIYADDAAMFYDINDLLMEAIWMHFLGKSASTGMIAC